MYFRIISTEDRKKCQGVSVTAHVRDDGVGAKGAEIMKRGQTWDMLGEVLKEPIDVKGEGEGGARKTLAPV